MLIRATTQKNFESDVLNGKRPSARHAPCKAPAEVPRPRACKAPAEVPGPRARQRREVSERLPRPAGDGVGGRGFLSRESKMLRHWTVGRGAHLCKHTLESAGSHTLERRILRYANYISIKRM